jgi:hypothetical protein
MPTLRGGINTVTDGLVFLVDAKNPTSAYSKDKRSINFPSPNSSYKHLRNTSIIPSIENNTTGTIAFWYYPQGTAAIEYFLQVTNGNSASFNVDVNNMLFRRNSNNSLQMSLVNDFVTQWNYTTPIGVISNDNWYHIVLVQDGSAPKIYIDNVDQTLTPNVTTDTTQWFNNLIPQGGAANLDLLIIGAYKTLTSNDGTTQPALQGRLDSYGIWSTNLSADDISELYNGGDGVAYENLSTSIKTNLVSWWGMNETAADRYDIHGGNTLIGYDGTSTGIGPSFDDGIVRERDFFFSRDIVGSNNGSPENGVALLNDVWEFDGANDYIDFGTDDGTHPLDVTTNDFSIMAWVRIDTFGTKVVLAKGGAGLKGYWFGINSGQQIVLNITDTANVSSLSTATLVANEWTHIAVSMDRDVGPIFYKNGIATTISNGQDLTSQSGSLSPSADRTIGAWRNGGGPVFALDGEISSVLFYNRALTADEVAQNFNATKKRFGL